MNAPTEAMTDRRRQILQAAMTCFAKRGFHQTSMHDISDAAGISVGLIYRYFENKEAVITAMADDHKRDIQDLLGRARRAESLREAFEILFTAHCCANGPQVEATFVVDLFAEAGRNSQIAHLVRDVISTMADGVTELIAAAPEMREAKQNLTASEMTELIFATMRGTMMRDVLESNRFSDAKRRERQLRVVRNLWRLLFESEAVFA
ncbi:MAG: TetR/AcrR family transcriptional regulator [Verrucomicrobiota bacterium]|nr:TetR/AcrR family transcriptional regulator [Verrucomicrobiota bacterium]